MIDATIHNIEALEVAVGDTCDLIEMIIEKLQIALRNGNEYLNSGDDALALKMYSTLLDVENGIRNANRDLEYAAGID